MFQHVPGFVSASPPIPQVVVYSTLDDPSSLLSRVFGGGVGISWEGNGQS